MVDQVQLTFPPGVVVDGGGTPLSGPVDVDLAVLQPSDFGAMPPFAFDGVASTPFHAFEVTISSGGVDANIDDDVPFVFDIGIQSPLFSADDPGLYTFDVGQSVWTEVPGTLTLDGSGGIVSGSLPHFTWFALAERPPPMGSESDTDTDADADTDTDTDTDTDYAPVDTGLTFPPVEPYLSTCSVDPQTEEGVAHSFVETESNGNRVFTVNAIPEHPVGPFPNVPGTPHDMTEQSITRRVPISPSGAGAELTGTKFGMAFSGIQFAPFANEYYDNDSTSGWQYEPLGAGILIGLDCNYAHVFPTGEYHYHGMPEGLMDQQGEGRQMYWVGYAGDGHPIYARWGHSVDDDGDSPLRPMESSWQLRSGTRPDGPGGTYDGTFVEDYEYVGGSGDLDECNGRTAYTPEHGVAYHYMVTDSFPYIPRCWVNTPNQQWVP